MGFFPVLVRDRVFPSLIHSTNLMLSPISISDGSPTRLTVRSAPDHIPHGHLVHVLRLRPAHFANAVVETDAGNGKVLSYLAAHAEIYRQEFHDNRVTVHCYLPRHLFHHIMGPAVEVKFLDGSGPGT